MKNETLIKRVGVVSSVVSVPAHAGYNYWAAKRYVPTIGHDGRAYYRATRTVGPDRRSERLAWQDAEESKLLVLRGVRHGVSAEPEFSEARQAVYNNDSH